MYVCVCLSIHLCPSICVICLLISQCLSLNICLSVLSKQLTHVEGLFPVCVRLGIRRSKSISCVPSCPPEAVEGGEEQGLPSSRMCELRSGWRLDGQEPATVRW